MKIAITGHRPQSLNNEYDLNGPVTNFIYKEINKILDQKKPSVLITGMALGVDMIFAMIAIERDIPFLAYIPCDNHEKMWPTQSKELYHKILEHANKKTIVSPGSYAPWKMLTRNRAMAKDTDEAIAVWNGTNGGTSHGVSCFEDYNRPLVIINPNDCDLMHEQSLDLVKHVFG